MKKAKEVAVQHLEADPVIGIGDWEVEGSDGEPDNINAKPDFAESSLNEFDGFDAYEGE